ncbi:MAG: hypothetical protein R2716_11085 [Microthrixaceae bacterium]
MSTKLVFFELEWAALDEERVEQLLEDPGLDFCAHHLRNLRRYRPHLLSEPEEKLLTEKSVQRGRRLGPALRRAHLGALGGAAGSPRGRPGATRWRSASKRASPCCSTPTGRPERPPLPR